MVVGAVLPDTTEIVGVDAGEDACASPGPDRHNVIVCELGTLACGSRSRLTITAAVDATAGSTLTARPDSRGGTRSGHADNLARVDVAVVDGGPVSSPPAPSVPQVRAVDFLVEERSD